MNLNTKHLLIRPFKTSDITEAYLSWLNDPEVTRFSNQRFREHNAKSCIAYQKSFQDSVNCFLSIIHLKDAVPVGTMTVYRTPVHGTADMGIMLGNRRYWRRGLGLEAWSAVLTRLLHEEGMRKVTGGTTRPNTGMVKIMEQSGMTLEAVRKRQELIDDQPVDLLHYARFSETMA